MDDIAHLPLVRIFGYLQLPDRATAARVCRRWAAVFGERELWRGVDFDGRRLLMRAACRSGDRAQIARAAELCKARDEDVRRDRLLAYVCGSAPVSTVEWFVGRFGMLPDNYSEPMIAALVAAAESQRVDVLRWLVERFDLTARHLTAQVAGLGNIENSVFWEACVRNNAEMLRLCVARGVGGDHARRDQSQAVHLACRVGSMAFMQELLTTFQYSRDEIASQVLHLALGECKTDLADWLIGQYELSQLDLRSIEANYLHAAMRGDRKTLHWIVGKIEMCLETKLTVVKHLFESGNLEETEWFICEHGITEEQVTWSIEHDYNPTMTFTMLTRFNSVPLLEWYIKRAPSVDGRDHHLLGLVMDHRHDEILGWLINKFSIAADTFLLNGLRLLRRHALCGKFETVKLIVQQTGLDLQPHARTLLQTAFYNNNLHYAQAMYDAYRPDVSDDQALIGHACSRSCRAHGEWLASLPGFDVYTRDRRLMRDLLLAACRQGHVDTVEWMIEEFEIADADAQTLNDTFVQVCRSDKLHTARAMYRKFGGQLDLAGAAEKVAAAGYHPAVAEWLERVRE